MMTKRPNILFLMSDEHRADVSGYEGNEVVRTPVLDELARTGVVFKNCYTPSPVCIPARQCLATGQLPRTCGVEVFGQDLEPFSMTFAEQFARNAYQTACCGKLHHVGRDQMQGWMERPAGDLNVNFGFFDGYNQEAHDQNEANKMQGNGKWSDAKEIIRAQAGGSKKNASDSEWTNASLRYFSNYFADIHYERPRSHKPLLFMQSLIQPHYPYACSEELMEYYFNRVPLYGSDEEVFDHPFLSQRQVKIGEDVSEIEARRATAAYYGMVEQLDGHFGSTLDKLRELGEDLDDWIIVYTTDHGEMLGQHGIWEKQKFFEASARVPLIIRWPKQFEPRVVEENVNLCDIFATLCELAGIPLPEQNDTVKGRGLDSRSLVPLMRGDASHWNNESISQFGGTNLMIKQDHLKYQYYDRDDCENQREVLFDLAADPSESRNLINDDVYQDNLEKLRQRCAELNFGPKANQTYQNADY